MHRHNIYIEIIRTAYNFLQINTLNIKKENMLANLKKETYLYTQQTRMKRSVEFHLKFKFLPWNIINLKPLSPYRRPRKRPFSFSTQCERFIVICNGIAPFLHWMWHKAAERHHNAKYGHYKIMPQTYLGPVENTGNNSPADRKP